MINLKSSKDSGEKVKTHLSCFKRESEKKKEKKNRAVLTVHKQIYENTIKKH